MICMNIYDYEKNKVCKSSGICDDKYYYKTILWAATVSTPKVFTDNSPLSPGPYVTVKNPSAKKSIRPFSEVLDVKQETDFWRLGAAKSNHKVIKPVILLRYIISKRLKHININEQVKNIFMIGSYSILWLFSPPKKLIALKCLLMIILNHS